MIEALIPILILVAGTVSCLAIVLISRWLSPVDMVSCEECYDD